MDAREAWRILKAKLAAIERQHRAELADNEKELRELIDNNAEARALAAVFEFLRDCKISDADSLRRALEHYLRRKSRVPTTAPKVGARNRD
jgi:hypothetical protein